MHTRYLSSLVRFGTTLLAGGLLLRLLVRVFPTGSISPVGTHFKGALGDIATHAFISAAAITGRGLALALPLALLFGLVAGLRPGSLPDRLLLAPLGLLAGIPALPAALVIVCALTIDLKWLDVSGAVYLALGIALWPWLTLAIRNAVAALAAEGAEIHPVRAATAVVGAVLSQAGNVALGSLAVGVYLVPDNGMLRMLELASRLADPVLLYTLLAPTMLLVALVHLAGDLLTALAGGAARAPRPLSRAAVLLGALLFAAGLFSLRFDMYAFGNTWLIALGALAVAALGGLALAVPGPVAARPGLPSLIAPVIAGLVFPVLFETTLLVQMAAIGLGCAPTLAGPIRRMLDSAGPGRATALAGAGLLTLGQAVAAQITLGIMNLGLPTTLPTLGRLVRTSLLANPAAQRYGPVLPALAATAGLFLLGLALQDRAGDEPLPAADPAPPDATEADEQALA